MGLGLLALPTAGMAAPAKLRVTDNIFTHENTAYYGTSEIPVAPANFKTIVIKNEKFSGLPIPDATAYTVTAKVQATAKGNGAAQLCAAAIYTTNASVVRCAAIPAATTKATSLKLVVPIGVKKQIKFAQLYVKSLAKKEAQISITDIKGTFTLPESSLALLPPPPLTQPLPVPVPTPAPGPEPVPAPTPAPSPEPTPSPVAPTLSGYMPAAAVLASKKILIVGGGENGAAVDTAVLYDQDTKTTTVVTSTGHFGSPLVLALVDGTAVIAGGSTNAAGTDPNLNIDIYSPIIGLTRFGLPLAFAPVSMTLLPNGNILFLQGASKCDSIGQTMTRIAQIYKPVQRQFTNANIPGGAVANQLPSGSLLIRGFTGCMSNAVTGAFDNGFSNMVRVYNPGPDSLNGTNSSYAYPDAGQQAPEPRKGITLKDGTIFYADYGATTGITAFQVYKPSSATFVSETQTLGYDPGAPVYEAMDGKILLANTKNNTFYWYAPATKAVTPASPTAVQYLGYTVAIVGESGQIIPLAR